MHPYWRNDDLLKGMNELGIHVTAYSPLGSEVKDQPSLLQDETLKKARSMERIFLLHMSSLKHVKVANGLAHVHLCVEAVIVGRSVIWSCRTAHMPAHGGHPCSSSTATSTESAILLRCRSQRRTTSTQLSLPWRGV